MAAESSKSQAQGKRGSRERVRQGRMRGWSWMTPREAATSPVRSISAPQCRDALDYDDEDDIDDIEDGIDDDIDDGCSQIIFFFSSSSRRNESLSLSNPLRRSSSPNAGTSTRGGCLPCQ